MGRCVNKLSKINHPRSRVLEILIFAQPVKKLSVVYGTRR